MPEKAWVPLCERERLSLLHIFAITLNQLTGCLIWMPCGALLNPMLQKLEVSNAITTVLYLIGPISGGLYVHFLVLLQIIQHLNLVVADHSFLLVKLFVLQV